MQLKKKQMLLVSILISVIGTCLGNLCASDVFGEGSPNSRNSRIDTNIGQFVPCCFPISMGTIVRVEPQTNVFSCAEKLADKITEGSGYMLSCHNCVIDCCGVVDRWIAYFRITSLAVVHFQIWRPTSGLTYELVGQYSQPATGTGIETFNIAASQRVTVKSGDKIGWWTNGTDVITYDRGNSMRDDNWLMNLTALGIGATADWSAATNVDDRSYAFRLDVEPNDAPTFTNLPASTSIANNVASGVSLYTVSVNDINPDDVTTLTVSMASNSQFSFDTSTLVLTTSTLTGAASTEVLVFEVVDQCNNVVNASYNVTIVNYPPTIHSLPTTTTLNADVTLETLLHVISVTDDTEVITCAMAGSVPTSYPFLVKYIVPTTDYGIYSQLSPGFNYTDQSTFVLTVQCTDSFSTVSGNFTVYLIENTPPVIENLQNATEVYTGSAVGATIFTVLTTEPNGDTLSYFMTCAPSSCPFQIFHSGAILVSEDLANYTISEIGYELYISVHDVDGTDGPKTLTVTFTDIPPYLNSTAFKTFFDEPLNIAWFVPCATIAVVTLAMFCYIAVTCHGENGCSAFIEKYQNRQYMFKQQSSTDIIAYPDNKTAQGTGAEPWQPWKPIQINWID